MLVTLMIIFSLTVMGGIYLWTYVLPGKNAPKGVAIMHGMLGFSGIIILMIGSYYYPTLIYCLLLFILAALGGTLLFGYDILGKKIPKFLAIGHGLIAMLGLVLLIFICIRQITM